MEPVCCTSPLMLPELLGDHLAVGLLDQSHASARIGAHLVRKAEVRSERQVIAVQPPGVDGHVDLVRIIVKGQPLFDLQAGRPGIGEDQCLRFFVRAEPYRIMVRVILHLRKLGEFLVKGHHGQRRNHVLFVDPRIDRKKLDIAENLLRRLDLRRLPHYLVVHDHEPDRGLVRLRVVLELPARDHPAGRVHGGPHQIGLNDDVTAPRCLLDLRGHLTARSGFGAGCSCAVSCLVCTGATGFSGGLGAKNRI